MLKIFTRNECKLLAMATMLCDHVAVTLVQSEPCYMVMRIIGRIAFPIFAYFLVEGFLHTSNYKKYLLRVGAFALLSEIPFDLAFCGEVLEFSSQNVMFTLFIALIELYFLRRWEKNIPVVCLVLVAGGLCGWLLRTDYDWFGVVVIGCFYLIRNTERTLSFYLRAVPFLLYEGIEKYAVFGVCILFLYREDKERVQLPKYLFYVFYPAHLLVLWAISLTLGGV